MLAARVAFVAAGITLAVLLLWWWVIPRHEFDGPVILPLTPTHGIHAGDLAGALAAAALFGGSVFLATRRA
jgi:hypothetical protein